MGDADEVEDSWEGIEMKLGTSLRFVFPTSEHTLAIYKDMVSSLPPGAFVERPLGPQDLAKQAQHLLEVTEAARDAGMWAVLTGDSRAVPGFYANSFHPVPTIARLSAVAGDLTIGALFLAPFHHPLLLAEEMATVAAFVDRPIICAFAIGERQGAFDAVGIPMKERRRRFEQLVPVVRALLAGESVTAEGPGWRVDGASISPVPRHAPSFLLGGSVDPAIDRAAHLGDGWITAQNATDDVLIRQLDRYREACSVEGRSPMPVLRRDVFVAPTDAEAEAHVAPILADGYRGLGPESLLVGSPERVVDRLVAYHAMGFDHVLVRHVSGDHDAIIDSIGLMGAEVIPEIARWPERSNG